MYLTGFADEAAKDIDGQIRATKELGWSSIESRNVNGRNLHDLPDDEFERVCEALAAAGVRVNCFGSAIANWGKGILDPPDSSLAEARRAVPRMKRLGTPMVRIMSYAVLKDRGAEDQEAEERFRRLRDIVALFRDEGLQPVHENCMNYGGMGWSFTLRMLENVPGLKLVFDTGNPVFSEDRARPAPHPQQSAWEFYRHVREHVVYVHIKDGVWDAAGGKARFTFPGEGDADVKRIVGDLLGRGYDGGFSIEPHLAVQAHDPTVTSTEAIMFRNYVEYGRRFMALVDEVRPR